MVGQMAQGLLRGKSNACRQAAQCPEPTDATHGLRWSYESECLGVDKEKTPWMLQGN